MRVAPMPLLVSGQVIDEGGAPVPSVFVSVRYTFEEGDRASWYNHGDRPYSDAEGRFELRTHHDYARIQVHAWRTRGGSSDRQEVPIGSTDVRLVYVPHEPESARGEVRGRVLADESIPWAGLELRFRLQGEKSSGGYRTTAPFAGSYRLSRMLPGTYGVTVVADGHGFDGPAFEFLRRDGIEVRAGETTDVDAIDLRGALRYFELKVLGPDGDPLDRVHCNVGIPDVRHTGGWIEDGRLAFVAPAHVDAFELSAGDFAPVTVLWSAEPQTVRLR